MKNIVLRIIFIFLVTLFVGCKEEEPINSVVVDGPKPESGFTYTRDEMLVKFTNTSTNAETYYWDFGDGTTSTEESPEHLYAAAGDYTIALKVNSAAGYSSKHETSVFVAGNVSAFFSYSAEFFHPGEFGRKITFDARASANAVSVTWDFGDGTTDNEGGNIVTHIFPDFGNYDVTITVEGLLGDEATYTSKIDVVADYELLLGGNMEAASAKFWNVTDIQTPFEVVFGYENDKPLGGVGGCLNFKQPANAGGYRTEVWQAVDVVEGAQYLFGAQVKLPAGNEAANSVLFFCIATESNIGPDGIPEFGDGVRNNFYDFNFWGSWGSYTSPHDGDLTADFIAGPGRYSGGTSGVYTASYTGKVYIGIDARNSWGTTVCDWLIDEIKFEYIPQ